VTLALSPGDTALVIAGTDTVFRVVYEGPGSDWSLFVDGLALVVAGWAAYFTAKAAQAASVATSVAAETLREQQRSLDLQQREAYYRTFVADPVLSSLFPFVRNASQLLEAGLEQVDAMGRDVQLKLIDDHLQILIDEFNRQYLDLRLMIITGVKAWGDEPFTDAVSIALDELQDKPTQLVLAAAAAASSRSVADVLQASSVRILTLVRTNHPVLRRGSPAPRERHFEDLSNRKGIVARLTSRAR